MNKQIISAKDAPGAIGPYSQAVLAGDTLYVSGQLGADPATGALPESVEDQARNAMKNIGAILKAAGMDYINVVKTTVFLSDLGDFSTVNGVYASFFSGDYPARCCVQAAGLPKGALVEIECVAVR